ncbi:MAG: serine protease, partial [Planctomycetaceae bacterium]
HFMDHLKSGRIVDHGSLSMTVAATLDGSVIVDQLLESSDAYRRGVREQSEIVSFAGRPIRSVNQFKNILGIYPNGWKLPLTFREGDQLKRVMVRLRPLHSESEMAQFSKKNSGQPKRLPPGQKPPPKPPEKYQKMLVKKSGFANAHFNKLKRDKLHTMLEEWGQFVANETWIMSGVTAGDESFEIVLASKGLGFSLGESESYYQPADDWQAENEPSDSGGFLTAMSHLRRLLTEGEEGFTEHAYFGAEPIDGTGGKVDVLRSVEGSIETRWYFSRDEPRLLGFDSRLSEDADECEVRFGQFENYDGRRLPSRIEVRTGETLYGIFQVEKVSFRSGSGAAK